MHACELVHVAGIIAYSGPLVIARAHLLPPAPLEQYWAVSKCRFENWNRTLKNYAALADQTRGTLHGDSAIGLRATLDEIFLSEMLTRVWTTLLVARDRRFRSGVDEPLARSVFQSQMEVRQRALKLLLHDCCLGTTAATSINRLRRRAERWSDVLVGGLQVGEQLTEFAVDEHRARDFAEALSDRRQQPGGRHAWRMTLISLRTAFAKGVCPLAANPDGNARVTASILGCLPGELFDATGPLQSLWMTRLAAVTSDTQGLISDWLNVSAPAKPHTPARRRLG